MDSKTANALDRYLTCPPDEEEYVDDTPRDWEGNEIHSYNQVYELTFMTTYIDPVTKALTTSTKLAVATDESGSLPDCLTEYGMENLANFRAYSGEEWLADWRRNNEN